MANSDSVNTLVTKIRQRADQLNSLTFDDTTELKPWLRDSLAQLYEILVSKWQDFYIQARPISLLANQQTYSLPSDFRAMADVYVLYANGISRERIDVFTPENMGGLTDGYYPVQPYEFSYRVMNNQLYVSPTPTQDAANALEILYTPQWQGPLLDYTTIDEILPNGWQEWVILDVLQKMNDKTRLMDGDAILRNKSAVQQRLLSAAGRRDGNGQVMIDSYVPSRRWFFASPAGPGFWTAP